MKQLINFVKLKLLVLAVGLNPYSTWAWKLKAQIEQGLFLYSDAIASYGSYLKLCSNDFEIWTTVGGILNATGKFVEALQCFDKVIALDSEFVPAILNKGYACSRLARYEDSIASYDKVLNLVPGHYQALLNKGHSWQFLKQYQKAIDCYLDAIAANPDDCLLATTSLVNCRIHMNLAETKKELLTFQEYLKAKYN